MRRLGLLLVLPACNSILGIGDFETAGGEFCRGTLARVCLSSEPSRPLDLTGRGTFDTDTDPACVARTQEVGPELCVVGGSTIVVGDLQPFGDRALVLVAATTVTIEGVLDGSSTASGRMGPAADFLCDSEAGGEQVDGGGGGAGGTFGEQGGEGGSGSAGGPGGVFTLPTIVTFVSAGCEGGDGGDGDFDTGGFGGFPGGAIYVIADDEIIISSTGAIFASGAGGEGGDQESGSGGDGGGGGGGSGGLIALEAPDLDIDGIVAANGGGGGGGGDGTEADTGMDGTTSAFDTRALGGAAGGMAGGGGDGGAGASNADGGETPLFGGGGGGGGGVGVVWLKGELASDDARISPPPTRQ